MGPDVAIIRGDESHNYFPPFPPTKIRWLVKGGLPVTGFREGSWGPPLTFPRAVLIFGISPVIGFKTLNRLASGILRVHGGEPSKPSVFVLLVFFKDYAVFVPVPSKPPKPSNPPVWYRQFLKRARDVPWGTVKTVSFLKRDRRSGRRNICLPPFCLPPFSHHPSVEEDSKIGGA